MALGASVLFCGLAYMNVTDDSRTVFLYFVNLVTIFGLETWISILVTHIYFVKARKAQNLPNSAMPYVAPLGIWGSYFALAMCVLVALTKNFAAFTYDEDYGNFDVKTFVTGSVLSSRAFFPHADMSQISGHSTVPDHAFRIQVLDQMQGCQTPRSRLLYGQGYH